jgi:hypothetical protein
MRHAQSVFFVFSPKSTSKSSTIYLFSRLLLQDAKRGGSPAKVEAKFANRDYLDSKSTSKRLLYLTVLKH